MLLPARHSGTGEASLPALRTGGVLDMVQLLQRAFPFDPPRRKFRSLGGLVSLSQVGEHASGQSDVPQLIFNRAATSVLARH